MVYCPVMDDLAGKRVLVTGAGRRVGAAIAQHLGAAGMHVAVHYRSAAAGAEETCRRIVAAGGTAEAFQADLSDQDACGTLIDRVVRCFGGLDALVASAASFEATPLPSLTIDKMQAALQLNLLAPLALAQRASAALRERRGSMVFITCTSRRSPYRDYTAYTVSKSALYQLMRMLALELAPDVRVNAVAPGTVMLPEDMAEELLEQEVARIPLRRAGEPEDVARAVAYLLAAPFVTGTELVVDGGRTLSGDC